MGRPGPRAERGLPGLPGERGAPGQKVVNDRLHTLCVCSDLCVHVEPLSLSQGDLGLPGDRGASGLKGMVGAAGDQGRKGETGAKGQPVSGSWHCWLNSCPLSLMFL